MELSLFLSLPASIALLLGSENIISTLFGYGSFNEVAAQNRLTITVQVKYVNKTDDTKSFESSFTKYSDYDSNRPLNEVENDLVKEINELLTQEIFNKAVSNW